MNLHALWQAAWAVVSGRSAFKLKRSVEAWVDWEWTNAHSLLHTTGLVKEAHGSLQSRHRRLLLLPKSYYSSPKAWRYTLDAQMSICVQTTSCCRCHGWWVGVLVCNWFGPIPGTFGWCLERKSRRWLVWCPCSRAVSWRRFFWLSRLAIHRFVRRRLGPSWAFRLWGWNSD